MPVTTRNYILNPVLPEPLTGRPRGEVEVPLLTDKILFGADPELILTDGKRHVPAWRVTKGTKESHVTLHPSTNVSVHADGVALEYNFPPANAKTFSTVAKNALHEVAVLALSAKLEIKLGATADGFDAADLMHPLALMTGCDPDFCAYSEYPTIPRNLMPPSPNGIKFFGGHIHIGYPVDLIPPHALARVMDALYYLQEVAYDPQGPRREFYGQAGVFRPKAYGLEYRTPSNFWVASSSRIQSITQRMVAFFDLLMRSPKRVNEWYKEVPWADVQGMINREEAGGCGELGAELWERLQDKAMT